MTSPEYDGIVVAGGAARRLGGLDKPSAVVSGRRLIDVAVSALTGARRVIVVGPVLGVPGVTFTSESPVGGGPVAALAAGLALSSAPLVVVLAADLPFVTADAVAGLVAAAGSAGSAVAVDERGRDQPLLAAYAAGALRAALPAEPVNASMRSVLAQLALTRATLPGSPPPWFDCDTPGQLADAQKMQVQ